MPAACEPASPAYEPGKCNIGPEEIARRRLAGHLGSVATAVVLGGLILANAPPLVRVVVFLPAATAASGYLQASMRFCAGYGSRGLYNFGRPGYREQVADPVALERDLATARRIGLMAAAIGAGVALGAMLMPRSRRADR